MPRFEHDPCAFNQLDAELVSSTNHELIVDDDDDVSFYNSTASIPMDIGKSKNYLGISAVITITPHNKHPAPLAECHSVASAAILHGVWAWNSNRILEPFGIRGSLSMRLLSKLNKTLFGYFDPGTFCFR